MKILTTNTSIESAMLLRDAIVDITGKHFLVTKDPSTVDSDFVRYGTTAYVNPKFKCINSPEFIRFCVNKENWARLAQRKGFFGPEFHTMSEPTTYPVLIRTTLTSYGGRGIIMCKNRKDFIKHWGFGCHWTPFVKTSYELRAHVVGGKIARLFKKEYAGYKPEAALPIRNLDNGYHFALVSDPESMNPGLVELLKSIHAALPKGADIYSVDAAWCPEQKKYFIFELNSGSGINGNTARIYANYIVKKLKLV